MSKDWGTNMKRRKGNLVQCCLEELFVVFFFPHCLWLIAGHSSDKSNNSG